MDIQTISNIVLCALSFILAAISIITVLITLRQNHQMIENSTRPYVTIYSRVTNFQEPFYYLIMKNFGQSKAIITSFKCDFDLAKCSHRPEHVPFQHIDGAEIMPGQSYLCTVNRLKLCADTKSLSFDISYTDGRRKYSEHCFINIETDIDLAPTRAATEGKELRNISYTLQDLVEKLCNIQPSNKSITLAAAARHHKIASTGIALRQNLRILSSQFNFFSPPLLLL